MVMAELKVLKPEWESVPYQVKRTAVRDACRAMSNVKTFNRQLAADRAMRPTVGRTIRTTAVPQSEEPPSVMLHTG